MGEGAKQSLHDTGTKLSEKRQGEYSWIYLFRSSVFVKLASFLDAEQSLKEAESEGSRKSKGIMESIRDWVAPAADKAKGIKKTMIVDFNYFIRCFSKMLKSRSKMLLPKESTRLKKLGQKLPTKDMVKFYSNF